MSENLPKSVDAEEEKKSPSSEVTIPLDPESPPKETTKSGESVFSICFSCFYDFLQVTTIKGAKQVSGRKPLCLRYFWIFFVFISFALVITICTKVFTSYTEYNTVIRQNVRGVFGRDMPIITMCSNAFFGDSKGIRKVLQHQEFYFNTFNKKARESIRKQEYTDVKKYQDLATIPRYNALNAHIWEDLTKDILARRSILVGGKMPNFQADQVCKYNIDKTCKVEPMMNLKYRNCISIKVKPQDMEDEVTSFIFQGVLLAKRGDIGVPVDDESAYPSSRQIDVFLHHHGFMPKEMPDFMFSVPRNRWVYLDLGITHLMRLKTPRFTCLMDSIPTTSHVDSQILLTGKTCSRVALRKLVREKCSCESLETPFDAWPLNNSEFCGVYNKNLTRMSQQFICESEILFNEEIAEKYKPCPIACSQYQFDAKVTVNNFDDIGLSAYYRNKYVFGMSKMLSGCMPGRKMSRSKSRTCKFLLSTLEVLTKNKTLTYNEIIQSRNFPVRNTYWDKAQPPMSEAESPKIDFEKNVFFMMIRVPKVSVLKENEKLVRTIWTTMAQAGGACSFLAGFTFVVIAEVVDTCVTFWRKRSS